MIHSETIDLLITGGRVFDPGQNLDTVTDVAVSDGLVAQIGPGIDPAVPITSSMRQALWWCRD